MSRIGKKLIPLPKGMTVNIDGSHVEVIGPKGRLERELPAGICLLQENDNLYTTVIGEGRKANALWGMARSLVRNMVVGVHEGFRKTLLIEGVGYKSEESKGVLTLNLGYSNPVTYVLPPGVKATVEKATTIILESIDKEVLGQTAAHIRAIRSPEPYKGKGIRYQNEYIARKAGKTGAKK